MSVMLRISDGAAVGARSRDTDGCPRVEVFIDDWESCNRGMSVFAVLSCISEDVGLGVEGTSFLPVVETPGVPAGLLSVPFSFVIRPLS